ncbi:hypothetical protein K3177_10020 [Qipengyuania sp. GH25]|uniref:Uncharacterized protein n=1 Tax=Qipengyuania pacifica TaxID=2860199 RepID=A0ABS7JFS0_9SPHN|nr:hypothetical protein [Qipengyuania aerophila]MBX7488849.1 hypothetical protein [Qipengyuania aerophila]
MNLPSHFKLSPGDVLAFFGGLLGTAATVGGGIYVLDRERKREDRERRAFLSDLLDEVEAACRPFQMANEAALVARRGITTREAVQTLKGAVGRVHQFRSRLEPKDIRMLKISDRILELEVDDAELDEQAASAGLYPNEADYGGLNAIGHEIVGTVQKIRAHL